MIFNEILIPQDSFTETNVTRKRFVVGKFITILPRLFHSKALQLNTFFMLENPRMSIKLERCINKINKIKNEHRV